MILTPDHAGRLICPLRGHCVAHKCAMWRWVPRREPAEKAPIGFYPMPQRMGKLLPSTHGYCGLAGRPEPTV